MVMVGPDIECDMIDNHTRGTLSGCPACAYARGFVWALAIVGMFEAIRARESTAERLERLGFERPPLHKMDPFVRPMCIDDDS